MKKKIRGLVKSNNIGSSTVKVDDVPKKEYRFSTKLSSPPSSAVAKAAYENRQLKDARTYGEVHPDILYAEAKMLAEKNSNFLMTASHDSVGIIDGYTESLMGTPQVLLDLLHEDRNSVGGLHDNNRTLQMFRGMTDAQKNDISSKLAQIPSNDWFAIDCKRNGDLEVVGIQDFLKKYNYATFPFSPTSTNFIDDKFLKENSDVVQRQSGLYTSVQKDVIFGPLPLMEDAFGASEARAKFLDGNGTANIIHNIANPNDNQYPMTDFVGVSMASPQYSSVHTTEDLKKAFSNPDKPDALSVPDLNYIEGVLFDNAKEEVKRSHQFEDDVQLYLQRAMYQLRSDNPYIEELPGDLKQMPVSYDRKNRMLIGTPSAILTAVNNTSLPSMLYPKNQLLNDLNSKRNDYDVYCVPVDGQVSVPIYGIENFAERAGYNMSGYQLVRFGDIAEERERRAYNQSHILLSMDDAKAMKNGTEAKFARLEKAQVQLGGVSEGSEGTDGPSAADLFL